MRHRILKYWATKDVLVAVDWVVLIAVLTGLAVGLIAVFWDSITNANELIAVYLFDLRIGEGLAFLVIANHIRPLRGCEVLANEMRP